MKISLEDYVLSGGDLGKYQIFLDLVSSISICMHTFGLTLEVFTALTPTCQFTDLQPISRQCTLNKICRPRVRSWEWDNPENSIISDFGLVCKDDYKSKFVSSYAFLGYIFGCIFWGWLGDKLGRLPVLHTCQFLSALLLYLTSITPNYSWYCLARVATGFTSCHWNTACVYAAEWGGRKNRSFTLIAHILYSSFAFALFGTIAYFIRPWRHLCAVLSVFGFAVFLVMLPSLRESPRWLFLKGKKEQAVKNVQFAARINGLPVLHVSNIETDIYVTEDTTTGTESIWLLFKSKRLIYITATFYLTSAANVLIYYMLKFSAENISSSPYLSCWLLALSDVPSAVLIHFCSKFERRKVNFYVQLIAVGFCYLCCTWENVRLVSAVLCMAFAAVSFNYVYLYLAEVYPTTMRNRVTAGCIAVAEIGGMVANPLVYTTNVWDILPFLIAATLAVGPTVASWWLPETRSSKLPDRLADTLQIVYTDEERPFIVENSIAVEEVRVV